MEEEKNKENKENNINKESQISDKTVKKIIDLEFDDLEDWAETEITKIKNDCIDDFNNFNSIINKTLKNKK